MNTPDNTPMYTTCQTAINSAVEKFFENNKSESVKVVPSCALRISFYHLTFINLVMDSFSPITGKLKQINGNLVAIFPNEAEARKVGNSLSSIIYAYNSELLETQFEQGWLSSYLSMESMGINCAMAEPHIQNIEQAESRLSCKRITDDDERYDERRAIAKNFVSDKSFTNLTDDVTKFLIANFDFTHSESDVIAILKEVYDSFSLVAQGKHGLDNIHDFKVMNALEKKSDFIQVNALRGDVKLQVSLFRQMESDLNRAKKLKERTKIRFDEINKAIKPNLINLFNSSKVKPDYVEFNGLDLMYSSPYEWKFLSARLLPNFTESFNDDIGNAVASLLTDYLITYVAELSCFKMKQMLNELSDQLDTKSFHSEYMRLVQLSGPFPSDDCLP